MPSKRQKRRKQQKEVYERKKIKLTEDDKKEEAMKKQVRYSIHPPPQTCQRQKYRQKTKVKLFKVKWLRNSKDAYLLFYLKQ